MGKHMGRYGVESNRKWRRERRILSLALAAATAFSLTACGGTSAFLEGASGGEERKAGEEEQAGGAEQPADGSRQEGTGNGELYAVTGENENEDLILVGRPESPYWFPEQLLNWTSDKDPDFSYNVCRAPLAKRVDREKLKPVNKTQNKETKVMAISIMNNSTSGNVPRGNNRFPCNTFSYWQYVDTLVYWGGSSGEGLIVAPSPDVTEMGHKNGVAVLGTCFFPQSAHGGKLEWLDEFLTQDESGAFPMAEKLIEAAEAYNFDGWFLNQETEGSEEKPLIPEHARKMRDFIAQFKKSAPKLELVYYDSMTIDGEMDWQNALTEKNAAYLTDEEGKPGADAMFLNFWWTEEELADKELLKASAGLAAKTGIDPYELYAGMDIQADGYMTQERWDLFENPEGGTFTSLGIYCPDWAFHTADGPEDFEARENALWVNNRKDPSAEIDYSSPVEWRGVSTYVIERSPLTELPFVTNFCVGNGYSFFIGGEKVSAMDWNNRSVSDVLPTYRWIIENEGQNRLTPSYSMAEAYYGGNSLKLHGSVEAGTGSLIKLYSADLPATERTVFTTVAKAGTPTDLELVLELDDGSALTAAGDKAVENAWTQVVFDIREAAGKSIRSISYRLKPQEASHDFDFFFGNITVGDGDDEEISKVSGVKADGVIFDEDAMYAGVRLSWSANSPSAYYEIFRRNQDGGRSFLGVSNTECFYVDGLLRTGDTNRTDFEVVPVNGGFKRGEPASAAIEWPDNSLPKADFTADATLIAPGGAVTFESRASQNVESFEWTFEGGEPADSAKENPVVTYREAGAYRVTLRVSNEAGVDEKIREGYISVRDDAAGGLTLLSRGKPAEATSFTNENESPAGAVDGDVTKKWCATGTPSHEITIDLGAVKTVCEVDISHAEAGGESPDMNTKAYTISVSVDGSAFHEVAGATKNTAGVTKDVFAPAEARYVKLSVEKPTQGSDNAARIYEAEVYGLDALAE